MDIEGLRRFCLSLPGVTEDVKWGNDLCFLVGGKMFCVTGLEGAFSASLKTTPDIFADLVQTDGILPAPYLARNHWVLVKDGHRFSQQEWELHIRQSYELVKSKLPGRLKPG